MRIDTLDTMPHELMKALEQLRPMLAHEIYTSSLQNDLAVTPALDSLDEYLKSNSVAAFHCTREPDPGYFAAKGLRKLNLGHHQASFLERFKSNFTAEEIDHFTEGWSRYFNPSQISGRDNMLWFCLTPEQLLYGCEHFFQYFGGEAVYKSVTDRSVKAKLERLGHPVVVEISIPGADILTHQRLAIGTLNAFHRRINPQAQFCPVEGHLRRCVTPQEIVKVWNKDDFFYHHQLPT